MRKNKLSTAGLAAILSVALVSGGIFAWFLGQDTAAKVDVSTGTIKIELEDFVPEEDQILPGSTVNLGIMGTDGKVTPAKLENTGSKDAIIELNLSKSALQAMLPADFDPATAKDYDATEFADDYEVKEVDGVDRYVFTEKRLKEVASLLMDTAAEKWTTVADSGMYYTKLAAKTPIDLTGLKLKVEKELGGNVGTGADKTAARGFEQETQFVIDVKAIATQSTAGAVKDVFGEAAYDALVANGFTIAE